MNKLAMDTIAACGDVNRNVMCTCLKYPSQDPSDPALAAYERTQRECDQWAQDVSIHLLPDGGAPPARRHPALSCPPLATLGHHALSCPAPRVMHSLRAAGSTRTAGCRRPCL